tara:strand:+ start:807 stop:980 length:174 start_codon:yes stop_codon:yes gene_type:complete
MDRYSPQYRKEEDLLKKIKNIIDNFNRTTTEHSRIIKRVELKIRDEDVTLHFKKSLL